VVRLEPAGVPQQRDDERRRERADVPRGGPAGEQPAKGGERERQADDPGERGGAERGTGGGECPAGGAAPPQEQRHGDDGQEGEQRLGEDEMLELDLLGVEQLGRGRRRGGDRVHGVPP